MRLTKKKIEEILLVVLGEEGLPVLQQLYGKENVSEFELAKKADLDIKVVRKMLYLLYNHNVVGFIRKKDKEKGWYIYYWTILPESVKFIYYKRKKNLLAKLTLKLEEENKELFFVCPKNCVRLNFDDSTDLEFHCPECGDLLDQDDNTPRIEFLTKKIALITKELDKLKEKKKTHRIKSKARKKVVKAKVIKKKAVKKKAKSKKKVVKKKIVQKKVVKKKAKSKKKVVKKKIVQKKVVKKKVNSKKKVIKKKKEKKVVKKR